MAKQPKEITPEVEVSRWIEKTWRQLFIALGVIAVLYGGYLGITALQERKEKAAQEELFTIQKDKDAVTEKLNADEDAAAKPADKKGKDAKVAERKEADKTPEALTKNYGDVMTKYEKFIEENKDTKASYMAAVQLAGLASEHGDAARAEKALSSVDVSKKKDLFYGLVRLQLGAVLLDQKKFKEAADQFQQIVDAKEQSYFHPQALLRLGVSHLESGDFDKAEAAFKRVEAEFATTRAANEAKTLKRLVALKKGVKGES